MEKLDLTPTPPRSVKDRFAGVVMLGRTTDKAKAVANGNIGEYHYTWPMDQAVFGLLGSDHEAYLAKVKSAANDGEIEAYAREFVAKKSQDEITSFNENFVKYEPEKGSDGEKGFLALRNQVAPDRTDVTAWADLLDLDEGRTVPHKTAV